MSGRPDPDTCTKCKQEYPLEDFKRRNGSFGKWCSSCRARNRGGNPAIVGERFDSPSDLLHSKYGPLLIRLRQQRDKYGRDLPDAAVAQLASVEEFVRDLEHVLDEKAALQMHPSRN